MEQGFFTLEELLKTHHLAQALAKSLGDAALRAKIRDAMRESPHAEHKLVFQEFAADPRYGEHLRRALDSRASLNSKEFDSILAGIPPLDFYLPWIEHRQTWRATSEVVIGATLDVNDPIYDAYGIDGRRQVRDARESAIPSFAIAFLQPAERKFPRRDDTSGPGAVVQDPGVVRSLAVARSNRGPLTPAQECDEGTPDCGGGGGSNFPLVLESFEYFYEGDAFGEGEIEFNIYYVVNGVVQKNASLYYGGDDCPHPHDFCTPNSVIWNFAPPLGSGKYLSVDPHEEDYPQDEHWGVQFHGYAPTFTSALQLGQHYELIDEL